MLSTFAGGTLFGERQGSVPLTVLALHGWGRTHRDFDQVLAPVDSAPLNSIALDLPGFGATPGPDRAMTSEDFALAIMPVLEEATEPVVVIGHSHGGRVAVCLAALRPDLVRALVLVGAPVVKRTSTKRPSISYRLARSLHRIHLISDDRFEARRRRSGSADYNAAQGVLRETLVTVINESFEEELRSLSCPVVLVWGDQDSDVPLEVAQRALSIIGQDLPVGERSPSRLEVLEGVGHLVPTSDPRALRRAIDSVLS
jgi:pimeloyl-ACP methyl ester carboxylesterase